MILVSHAVTPETCPECARFCSPLIVRAFLFLVVLVSCSGKDATQPGTSIGKFRIQGAKQTATCGDAAIAPDPWVFDVRFSRDASTLYWVQNRAPITGHIGADRKVTFKTTQTVTMRAADRFGRGACVVTRVDTVDIALGPDEPLGDAGMLGFSSTKGTLSYAYTAQPGSDCTGVPDPAVSVLPCSTVYAIDGTKVGP